MRRLTLDEFIARSRAAHGDTYGYDKVKYVNTSIKVAIVCPVHGDFSQTPRSHMQGVGCSRCAANFRLTTEDFISKAEKIHAKRYTYEKTVYSKHNKRVAITCKVHGVFMQLANSHLSGSGCFECGGRGRLTDQDFIDRAVLVHGDTYDYPNPAYTNMTSPVSISCRVHGVFSQIAGNHLSGKGCRKCGGTSAHTTTTFLDEAVKVHKDTYNYSRVRYVNNRTGITITCKTHGEFTQTPHNHLLGKGCPKCAGSGFNPGKQSYLYFLVDTETHSRVKIGVSNVPEKRLSILKNDTPFTIERIDLFETPPEITLQIEKFCHSQLESCGLQGFNGATEWFKFDGGKLEALREFIKSCGGLTP